MIVTKIINDKCGFWVKPSGNTEVALLSWSALLHDMILEKRISIWRKLWQIGEESIRFTSRDNLRKLLHPEK